LEAAGEHKRELLMLANKNGDTCMHISAEHGRLDILQALLEAAGEHKRELLMLANKNGDTCMHISTANGHLEMADALRNASEQGGS